VPATPYPITWRIRSIIGEITAKIFAQVWQTPLTAALSRRMSCEPHYGQSGMRSSEFHNTGAVDVRKSHLVSVLRSHASAACLP
jgi:hypothetical protein